MGVADKLARNGVSDNVRRILQAHYCRGDKSSSWDVVSHALIILKNVMLIIPAY
jgi:hypothetical protein